MTGQAAPRHAVRLVLLFWILMACFYSYLSFDYIRASMNDKELGDYLEHIVQLAGSQQRPSREIRTLLLIKAQELDLPVKDDQITIRGVGVTLNVAIDYMIDIQIPIFDRGIYG